MHRPPLVARTITFVHLMAYGDKGAIIQFVAAPSGDFSCWELHDHTVNMCMQAVVVLPSDHLSEFCVFLPLLHWELRNAGVTTLRCL